MYQKKKILAIIPARGGSKRLPGKNIKTLGDKPLIAWSIEAAKGSRYIDRSIVTTESISIVTVAKEYGADIPFIRPQELAQDDTRSIDVVLHAVRTLEEQGEQYDYVMLLQPTSPFRNVGDIDASIEMLFAKSANAIISVTPCEHHPLWSNYLGENFSMEHFLPEKLINSRSQDLPPYYRLNGAIYLCATEVLKREKSFFPKKGIYAYVMPQDRSVDIDTELDFLLAEAMLQTHTINKEEYTLCQSI